MGYWLFYAGPENYLCERGERDFANEEGPWLGQDRTGHSETGCKSEKD